MSKPRRLAKCNCSDVSGNAGPCPEHAAQFTEFDDWWIADGKFFDPDFSEIPWFDKRKDLAEYAWHRGRASMTTFLNRKSHHIREAAIVLTNACQILDVAKGEWAKENCWSDWDQSVRDSITKWLLGEAAVHGEGSQP